jgi:hypothetical protein
MYQYINNDAKEDNIFPLQVKNKSHNMWKSCIYSWTVGLSTHWVIKNISSFAENSNLSVITFDKDFALKK